ncbi:hypothetical protein HYFRA_00008681 [Hymenoscyphus fraxineus]|uniref:2EXR domain-containing protein n=1 Tax=Hymenoscyphus fraxineus TaxID=746836 RepID=A0A9N9KZU3_9HELO|nr:hypothetical protein HYFRA_00008681 [Hymenoscyphus fraxineus]
MEGVRIGRSNASAAAAHQTRAQESAFVISSQPTQTSAAVKGSENKRHERETIEHIGETSDHYKSNLERDRAVCFTKSSANTIIRYQDASQTLNGTTANSLRRSQAMDNRTISSQILKVHHTPEVNTVAALTSEVASIPTFTEFTLFPELPVELRLAVWSLAVKDLPGHAYEIRRKIHEVSSDSNSTASQTHSEYHIYDNNPQREIESVCREARTAALDLSTLIFKGDAANVSGKIGRVNLQNDTLFFGTAIGFQELEQITFEMGVDTSEKVRSICRMQWSDYFFCNFSDKPADNTAHWPDDGSTIFHYFPRLERIGLTLAGTVKYADNHERYGWKQNLVEVEEGLNTWDEAILKITRESLWDDWEDYQYRCARTHGCVGKIQTFPRVASMQYTRFY